MNKSTGKIKGIISYELFDKHGFLKQSGTTENVITVQGNAYYVDRLSDQGGSAAQLIVLGTSDVAPGTTDVWVGSAFAGNGTVLAGGTTGVVAISTNSGTASSLQYVGTFGAGYATQTGITEAIITNRNPEADGNGTPNATTTFCVSHGTLNPAVNKGASDTLIITWDHLFVGS